MAHLGTSVGQVCGTASIGGLFRGFRMLVWMITCVKGCQMSKDKNIREIAPGENLALEWKADPWQGSLWDALVLGETNPNAALERMKQLTAKGSPLSMFYLGDFYTFGRFGIERDFEAAEHWLRQAASMGSIEGSYLLARHLEGARKYKEAENEYKKLAEREFSPALFALGVEHYNGEWLKRDIEQSIEYFERAEKLGHLHAKHRLWHIFRKEKSGITYKIKGWLKWLTLLVPFVLCKVHYPNSDRLRL